MLYLVSTPIGHLKDISLRAIEVLKTADLILSEDTSVSLKLLRAYDIDTPLDSYHKFSERSKLQSIINQLTLGKNICLISDAGTPGICDPGALLVKECYSQNIKMTAIPGASALTMAMSLSGEESAIQFLGFVPKKSGERRLFLEKMVGYEGMSFAFDTPHQIQKTLEDLTLFETDVILFRELTKMFEEILTGSPKKVLEDLKIVKGEFVLGIKGKKEKKTSLEEDKLYEKLTTEYAMSPSLAVKLMSEILEKNKKELYKKFISKIVQ
jgi:16S rRNA (cytidine1402-2'-O)-methyltransferase